MNAPKPALVTQRAVQRLPRLALLLFCAAYVIPGIFGRDPWRGADVTAFGIMSAMAEGRVPWLAPTLGGMAVDVALLPHWLGAAAIMLLSPLIEPALAARLPFALLLALALACTWYTTFHLARTEAAQPVAFAFGGEADPVDYARALADGALLALIATLGLLQLGHETTPELVQLFATALALYGLAAGHWRVWRSRLAVLAALPLLAASGAPAIALSIGALGCWISARSSFERSRGFMPWLQLGMLAAAGVAVTSGAWAWRFGFEPTVAQGAQLLRQWLWFMWPAWPMALWTLWRWRRQLTKRHVSVPLASVAAALAANVWMGGNDRALMLTLPGLAVLAAFALPTLQRSASALIDWFSVCFFSICALFVWAMYVAMQTGSPARWAANLARLAPGFEPVFSAPALAVALAASLAWLALVRWRTGRHQHALWKSLVLPAGGVALSWLLLMTLWLPLLDFARSPRPVVERVAPLVAGADCIAGVGFGPALAASFEVFGNHRVDARPDAAEARRCQVLVRIARVRNPEPLPGWTLAGMLRRPTERAELIAVYRRTEP